MSYSRHVTFFGWATRHDVEIRDGVIEQVGDIKERE